MIEIAGYRILERIGQGRLATVYRAIQVSLEREVALKVLDPAHASEHEAAQRFLEEARRLAGLQHPNIVAVFDVGDGRDGLYYFSMRYLPGGDLASRLAAGPLGQFDAARILHALALALAHIHGRGLVHRDVTPRNVLFDADQTPCLTDFGVDPYPIDLETSGLRGIHPMALRYMSPELLQGARFDHRADLYSLGVLAYELLTGKRPFEGEDPFEIAYAHMFNPVPRLPSALARWQPLIDQAMAKHPDARLQDAESFAALVERCVPEHISGLVPLIRAPHLEHIRTLSPAGAAPESPRPDAAAEAEPTLLTPAAGLAREGRGGREGQRRSGVESRLRLGLIAAVVLLAVGGVIAWRILGPRPGTPSSAVSEIATATPGEGTETSPSPVAEPSRPPPLAAEPLPEPPEPEGSPAAPAVAEPAAEPERLAEPPPIEPSALPTVLDPVRELVREGNRLLRAQRLMRPPGASAFDSFRLALRIDPGAREAREGLIAIADAYLEMAAAAPTLEERMALWQRAGEAVAGVDGVEAALERIAAARASEIAAHLEAAEQAFARWDGAAARREAETVLKIDPEHRRARELVALSARVGRPGWRFRDRFADGRGDGPELAVASPTLAIMTGPVRRGEFRRFWEDGGSAVPSVACRDRESLFRSSRQRGWQNPGFPQDDDHPVVCVTVAQAEAFARWLSQRTGQRYRLPRVEEWLSVHPGPAGCAEANRGDQRFRAQYGGRAAPCDDGFAATSPVGRFAASGIGLYDMNGNVREWTADCADDSGRCRERWAMGTAWHSVEEDDRVRRELPADVAHNTVGFRLVRELDPRRTLNEGRRGR
ncbi:MAG: bifunctional serine/threonine-protein kinase/formylglycine-generating enzyme family protein [Xanthomonadales bacterium]|nr:bifunctional serine/threonine-protein kinase/formylglycine-generating enzyme family protein [Xanthomonadales bacterium]